MIETKNSANSITEQRGAKEKSLDLSALSSAEGVLLIQSLVAASAEVRGYLCYCCRIGRTGDGKWMLEITSDGGQTKKNADLLVIEPFKVEDKPYALIYLSAPNKQDQRHMKAVDTRDELFKQLNLLAERWHTSWVRNEPG